MEDGQLKLQPNSKLFISQMSLFQLYSQFKLLRASAAIA